MSALQRMAAGGDQAYSTLEAVPHQVHQPSKRKWILFVGAVGLIAVLAAVLGGVFGSRHTSSATVSPDRLSNSSVMSPSARPPQRNIAALSFALNSVNNTRIYFQDDVGQIMEAANSAANTTWSINRTGVSGKNGSAIAAASSYSNVSTGYETWIEVLSLSNKGIEVDTWSGAINDWVEQYAHPSVMVNMTSNKKTYGDVAVTATGNAFGVVIQDGQADGIENWLVADNMVDWSLIGNVDLGGAWG